MTIYAFGILLLVALLCTAWFIDDINRLRTGRTTLIREFLEWEYKHFLLHYLFWTVLVLLILSFVFATLDRSLPSAWSGGAHVVYVIIGDIDLVLLPLLLLNMLAAGMTDGKYLKGVRTFDMTREEL